MSGVLLPRVQMEGVYMAEIIYEPVPDSKLLGVARAINGIRDAVAIVHGKSCCHADSLLFNILTGCHDDIRLVGSGIRSQDISVGGHRKLSLAIQSAYQEFNPRLIAVLVTSFTTLMGDDVDGIIKSIKRDVPCEICSFACPGYIGHASNGYEEVLSFLVRYMEGCLPEKGLVNIVGFKPDDPHSRADLEEIKRMLGTHGVRVNAMLTGSSFDEIRIAPKASLNVVISRDGIGCARLMEEIFNIPYIVVPYPFGWQGSLEFLEGIADALNISLNQDAMLKERAQVKERLQGVYTYLQGIYGLPVAVVGDATRAKAISHFLNDELGLAVRVLCITGGATQDIDLCKDVHVDELLISKDQFQIEEALRSKDVGLVFGSTMEKRVCRDLGIPLIRIFYPVLDAVSIAHMPYAGFEGVINLTETVINSIIGDR